MTGKVIFIVGPTAIGKTRISIELAKRVGGEIISADSMQVYKGMRVLSQAPSREEARGVKHHLIGTLDPRNEYSAAIFKRRATNIIAGILKRGKLPIVVGGSGLYVKALIDGLFPSPKADLRFRKSMLNLASRHGSPALHARLRKIDPEAASAIHPNDTRRIVRALEVWHSTGRKMTELKAGTKGLAAIYNIRLFGLTRPRREDIYSNIDSRVDKMFDAGTLLPEVRRLRKRKLSKTAGMVLGLREILGYIDGACDLETAKSDMKRSTRRFAKRQLTWFWADKRIEWFDPGRNSEKGVLKQMIKKIKD